MMRAVDRIRSIIGWLIVVLMIGPSMVASAAEVAPANANACAGSDLLSELAAVNPAAHARVLAAAQATENDEALLWKVQRDGTSASYLFGTIHLTDPRVNSFSPALERILDTVDRVAVEIDDFSAAAMQPILQRATSLLVFTDGQRLERLLSPAEYDKVKLVLSKIGVPSQAAGMIRPWFVTMVLAVSNCERSKTKSGAIVVDMRIVERARKRGAEVIGLESMDEQLTALASIPLDEQVAGLRAGLAFADRSRDVMETTLQMYLQHRMGGALQLQRELATWAGVQNASFAGFESELLDKRNIAMPDRALPMIEQGNALVAVGALHLIGKTGLVALLRDAGYTVTALE